jgi:LysR family transcriptional regulator, transcriptional activator of nhaA
VNYLHLYHFWVVAREGGLSAATRVLGLTQPTLTRQIQELERSVGGRLFERDRRGVGLTARGRLVFEHCQRIFSAGEALEQALEGSGQVQAPSLLVGIDRTVPREVLLQVLDFIQETDPAIALTITSASLPELQEALERKRLDLAVCGLDLGSRLPQDFHSRLAGSLPITLVASPALKKELGNYPWPDRRLPLLARRPSHPVRKDMDDFFAIKGVRLDYASEVDDPELIRALALRGKGAASLNAAAVKEDLATGRLVPLLKSPTGVREHIWLVADRAPHPSPPLARVLSAVMTRFRCHE